MLDAAHAVAPERGEHDRDSPPPGSWKRSGSEARRPPMFNELRDAVHDCCMIAIHLRSLASLFEAGLVQVDGGREPETFEQLVDQGFLMVDITRTMADRLSAVEERAVEHIRRHELEAAR